MKERPLFCDLSGSIAWYKTAPIILVWTCDRVTYELSMNYERRRPNTTCSLHRSISNYPYFLWGDRFPIIRTVNKPKKKIIISKLKNIRKNNFKKSVFFCLYHAQNEKLVVGSYHWNRKFPYLKLQISIREKINWCVLYQPQKWKLGGLAVSLQLQISIPWKFRFWARNGGI